MLKRRAGLFRSVQVRAKTLAVAVTTTSLRVLARRARTAPGVTVVIISWNSLSFLRTTLSAVRRFSPSDVEILVVDNDSTDGSKQFLRNRQDLRAILLPSNIDHGPALDVGFLLARTEFIVSLDVDAFPISDRWLSLLIDPLMKGWRVAGVHSFRDYAHPSCLAMRFTDFLNGQHTFRANWGSGTQLGVRHWDTAELISMRERGRVFLIEPAEIRGPGFVGTTFADVIYHNFLSTRTWKRDRESALRAWEEAKIRYLG